MLWAAGLNALAVWGVPGTAPEAYFRREQGVVNSGPLVTFRRATLVGGI